MGVVQVGRILLWQQEQKKLSGTEKAVEKVEGAAKEAAEVVTEAVAGSK